MSEPGNDSGPRGSDEPMGPTLGDIFSTKKPRDAKAGFASGLKSMAKGVVGGVAGLVTAPIAGAATEGARGFAKGVAAGVVSAVALPIAGIGVGAVQMVRGVVNQPEAVRESHKGKVWDQERREWIDAPGVALTTFDDKAGRQRQALRRPKEGVSYYALLQVEPDSTSEQIKKQYYILARKYHPDKNPDDPQAKERFQQLGEAYQVLANPELREKYDRHGVDGLDVDLMDGAEFFNMLFGSEQFEHFVGELVIATAARSGGELDGAQLKAAQVERVDKLVINLDAMLKRYVAGDVEGFKLAHREEAARLVAASFGETLLHTIGKVYEVQADIASGGLLEGTLAKLRQSRDSVHSQLHAANAAIKVYQHQQRVEQWEREKAMDAQKRQQLGKGSSGAGAAGTGPTTGSKSAGSAATTLGSAEDASSHQQPVGGSTPAGSSTTEPEVEDDADAAGPSGTRISIEELLQKQALEEAALPLVLEAMWAANVLDIQTTLRKVCRRLLKDDTVAKPLLKQRAMALKELGVILQEASADQSKPHDAKVQMEEAMQKVMEKKMGEGGQ